MHNTKAKSPPTVSHTGISRLEALTITTIAARMHHAVTSSTAAQAIATDPTLVFSILRSVRIRASTGNAVTLIAAPMNRAKPVKLTPGGAKSGYRWKANAAPNTNGTMMLTWL